MSYSSRLLPGLCAIIFPLLAALCWHSLDQRYPVGDEAVYFGHPHDTYLAFREHGIHEALRVAYLVRHDKAIVHPLAALPALLATQGDVLMSLKVTLTFQLTLFLIYLFGLFRHFLSPWPASVATLAMGLSAGVLGNSFSLNSEFPMMICVVATLFHLLKRQLPLAALWLGVGFCVRPVEITILFALPLVCLTLLGFQQRKIRGRDLAAFAVCLLTLGVCFVVQLHQARTGQLPEPLTFRSFMPFLFLALAPAPFVLTLRKKLKLNPEFALALAMGYIVVVVGLLPVLHLIYEWVSINSFSDHAMYNGNRLNSGYFDFLFLTGKRILGFPFLWIFALALLGTKANWSRFFFIGTAMALLHPFIGALSYNGDIRYYAGSGVILYVLFLVLALHPNAPFPRTRLAGIVLLISLLSVRHFEVVRGMKNPLSFLQTKWNHNDESPLRLVDPRRHFVDEMRKLFPKSSQLSILIRTATDDPRMQDIIEQPPVTTVQKEFGLRWNIYYTELDPLLVNVKNGHRHDVIVDLFALPASLTGARPGPSGYELAGHFKVHGSRAHLDTPPEALAVVYSAQKKAPPANSRVGP